MAAFRIIPRLEIKGPNLVKGVQMEGLRVLGPPNEFAQFYCDHGADELIYTDVVASLYQRNSLWDIINTTARNTAIPLAVEGGIRSIDDMRRALCVGADKVALNTAAVSRPELIREAAHFFGSSTIVISIQAKRQAAGGYEAYVDNGRERTGLEVVSWAKQVAELGAGEILLTCIDREGTGNGFDLDLIRSVATAVPIPVIACGGAGTLEHISAAVVSGKADAIALSSVLHYHTLKQISGDPQHHGGTPMLGRIAAPVRMQPCSIADVKSHLAEAGIECRQ